MKRFKELLAEGTLIRTFATGRIPHPVIVEMFGLAGGFHGVWLDQEHTGLSYDQVMTLALTARANGMDSFVRMAPLDYSLVTQNLEAGAGGVMAARIESAAQAAEFVSWCKFAPEGQRGMNTGGRDAHYTFKSNEDFVRDANAQHFVSIQIEMLGALNDVDEIAALPGVDLLFVGPSDLTQSMGITNQFDHPKLWEACAAVSKACQKHGKHWGTVGPSRVYVDKAMDLKCSMINFAGDLGCIRQGIDHAYKTFDKYFEA